VSVENTHSMADEATTGLARSLIGTVLSGRYRLESKLGSGGMSTVYLARDGTLERWVAVKVMHREISDQPDQLERFRREARAVAQLSHPNVVAVIDAGEDGGHPYIVFEFVDGETLKQRIERVGPLPVDEATAYAIEIGRGLAAAHARRLVHRDVKPQNVLIDPEGRAKVTDFGIARSLESDGLTQTGRVLGTPDYVSPEQAMGRGVDARTDIYSLGVLLYEMLTGEVPFTAGTVVGVAMKHVNEQIPDVQSRRPEVSSALAAVVERATAKEPKKRYPDMAGCLADLEDALEIEVARAGGAHGQATTVLGSVPGKRKVLTTRRVSAAGVFLVLAATAAALLITALTGSDDGSSSSLAPTGAPVKIVGTESFDPSPGDGEEHDEELAFTTDGNPGTGWTTESYEAETTEDAVGKPGVGLVLDAGEPVAARTLRVRSATDDWNMEVYGSESGPPTSLRAWGKPIGAMEGMGGDEEVPLDATRDSRYYLIWITKLAELDGGFGVQINEVGLKS
jgi:eukaryotic-like serine/threonine-protein kinase